MAGERSTTIGPGWILVAVLSLAAGTYFGFRTGAAVAERDTTGILLGLGALLLIGLSLLAIRTGSSGAAPQDARPSEEETTEPGNDHETEVLG